MVRKVTPNLYLFCKQLPPSQKSESSDGFHTNGTQYKPINLLYRLETANKQGDNVIGENPAIDALVKDAAKLLDQIRFEKEKKAIQENMYGTQKKGRKSKAPTAEFK